MHNSLLSKSRELLHPRKKPIHTTWPLDENVSAPKIRPQTKSPFFSKLSAELRISIYQAILTDPTRFLHICINEVQKKRIPSLHKRRRVAHFRCTNMDAEYPTWQHTCFGERMTAGSHEHRGITETDDKFIIFLLTCRRIYTEALPILYHENTFHIRGSPGIMAFYDSLPLTHWRAIRHLHISTFFDWVSPYRLKQEYWPPEVGMYWARCSHYLSDIPDLRSLKLDISLDEDGYREGAPSTWEADLKHTVLLPFQKIRAMEFEIEVNVVPDAADIAWWADFGGNPVFDIVKRERPWNDIRSEHGWGSLHDASYQRNESSDRPGNKKYVHYGPGCTIL